MNYKSSLYLLFIVLLGSADIYAQEYHRFSTSISAGISKTGSLSYSESYREFTSSPTVVISKSSLSRNNNFNFSIGYHPSRSISLNGSIGVASYGFLYSGDIIASPTNMATVQLGDFSTRLMEVGFSASYRIHHSDDLTFLAQPGLVWYTNPKERFSQVLGINQNSNNFSFTLFTGIEVPLSSNSFFANIGINTKVALDNFASNIEYKFEPFAIGLQASIAYRFLTAGT